MAYERQIKELNVTAHSAVPVVYIIAEEPRAIRRLAKIVRQILPQAEVKTIYGVFRAFGRESMKRAARRLARVKPDPNLIVSAIKYREEDSDFVVEELRRFLHQPLIAYAKAYARPGGHWLVKPEGENSSESVDPLIEQLRRAA